MMSISNAPIEKGKHLCFVTPEISVYIGFVLFSP